MLMADSDSSPSVLPRSPLIPDPVETLDESSSSPIASIGADAVQSLALSSPNRDHDDPLSAESSIAPRNLDGSPSTPLDETLIVPSPVSFEHGDECNGDTRAMVTESQIPPLDHSEGNNNPSTQAPVEINDSILDMCFSENRQQWTPNVSPGYDTDDESSMELWSQPLLRFKHEPFKFVEPSVVGAGLWNLGNSCFVNSVLQCFTHTVPLIECLYTYEPQDPCHCGNEGFCVIKALRCHIKAALTTSRYSISPYYFLHNLNYFSPDFQRYQQEDAHEFLQAFLDKLELCCLDRTSGRGNTSSDQDVNIVQHVFGGRLVSGLRCCNCNSVSETFENSLGLSLEIEDVYDLRRALDSFTRVEKLEEQMTCDNCKEKVSKEKQLLLDKLPMVATFHLKRFKNNGYFMEKIFNHVWFPLELDLQPYMRNSQNNEVDTKYHLYALVNHFGSLAYGHYYSYVRSAPNIWHRFDDNQVTRIDEDSVLPRDSYILFYAREGTPWFSRAFESIQPLIEASLQKYSSPKSVLDPTTNGECISEISNEKPCDSSGVSDLHVKTEENFISLSNESNEEEFQSAESSGEDSPMTIDLSDPFDPDEYDSHKKEPVSCLAFERAATGDIGYVSLLMAQNQELSESTFQIGLKQSETTKKQEEEEEEEEDCKQRLLVSDVADSKETEIVRRGLMKKASPHARELEEDISNTGSPPKKQKELENVFASGQKVFGDDDLD